MSWISRIKNGLFPRKLDDQLREEMSDHLARRAAALRDRGLSPEEAKRQASIRFGNVTQLREQSREIRLSAMLESTLQDVRYSWRGILKSPAFAITAILSLALAIGANTAIYSIVDAAMLRPLPVAEPDRLIRLALPRIDEPGSDSSAEDESFSYPLYLQFRTAVGDSARLALFSWAEQIEVQIPNADAPIEKAVRQFVSGESFDILGATPALGRLFSADEDRVPWGHPFAVISYDYWKRRFQSDPGILGRRMQIGGKTYSIIGVARQGFFGVEPGKFVDVWLPAMMYSKAAFTSQTWSWFRIFGRLSPGTTRMQVQARLQPVLRDHQEVLVKGFPTMPPAIRQQFRDADLRVHPGATGASNFRETFARPLWIVLGVSAGILLIACSNVASLLLARATARAAEMAMRISLGAARARLVRQLVTESMLLATLAGALGWIMARLAAPVLVGLLSRGKTDPVRFALSMDTRVLLFSAAVSTLAAVMFGLLPAWQASGAQPIEQLRDVRAGLAGKLRLGRFFVGIQVAFAFSLVVAGASFLFSLRNLFAVDTGFDPRNVAVITLSSSGLSDMTQKEQLNLLLDQLQTRIEALPEIQGAATAQSMLFDGTHWSVQVILPGRPPSEREESLYSVSPRYFSTMRIPLLAGRDFEQRDRSESSQPRPIIVNQAFARRYFGDQNPLGRVFQTPYDGMHLMSMRVIGVVANSTLSSLRNGPQPIVFTVVRGTNLFTLYVRSHLALGSVVRMVDREAQAIGFGTRIREVTTLETLIGSTLLREKLLAEIGGFFAFLGLLLAAIGLFGLLNYSVKRRTREIGIRAALGARPRALVVLVFREIFGTVGAGLMAGLVGAIALLTGIRSLLFGIALVDPLVVSTAAAVFLAAAGLAGGLPATRAATIDPTVALRHE